MSAFERFDEDWGTLTSSELNAAAKRIGTYATEHQLYSATGVTDATGRTTFFNLDAGLYLISRANAAESNQRYGCDPFLISVPETGDGTPTFAVTAEPKFSDNGTVTPPTPNPNPEPNKPSTPTQPRKPTVPANTGAAISALALFGIGTTVAAVIIFDLKRRRSN
ncbi:hypothetical protein [Bifidobacterium olomucense]|uniref:hypothetical protein n=1 Tax=Bifidobacterium olomucense TaxID=2675324 RepID=UPI00145CF122|nr:hypothetical protein [Bifidobacterium sp. DSM 109959]